MDARALIHAFYEEIWNRHDTSRVPALVAEGLVFRGSLGQERHGHDEFIAYVDFVHAALGGYRCEIQEIIAEGDRAFARMLFSGTHRGPFFGYPPTGRPVSWAGAAVFTFRDQKIATLWVLGDIHDLLRQLAADAEPQ